MLAVALIAFALFRFVGDPVAQMVGQETPLDQREQIREQLGLNDPVPLQFVRYVADTAQGKFGISYRTGRSVDDLLRERLPATLELSFVAALFALLVGVPMGVYIQTVGSVGFFSPFRSLAFRCLPSWSAFC